MRRSSPCWSLVRVLRLACLLCATAAVATYSSCRAATATEYIVHDLGPGRAYAVNNAGQACGYLAGNRACIWTAGTPEVLTIPGCTQGLAVAINNTGAVLVLESTYGRAHIWSGSAWVHLGGPTGFSYFVGTDINDSLQVCGYVHQRSYVWSAESFAPLAAGDGLTYDCAMAINNFGQVCGYSYAGPYPTMRWATLWSDDTRTELGAQFGTNIWSAYGLNDAGAMAGVFSAPDGYEHGYLLSEGVLTDLGTLGGPVSYARGVNNRCQVVGYSRNAQNAVGAFLWEDGAMRELPTIPGAMGAQAQCISDTGWIAGFAVDASMQTHAIVWEPVPEPGSHLALSAGLLSSLLLARRKRKRMH